MRVGIVGCGNIAQVHGQALKQLTSIEIVAFSDCRVERAEKMSMIYTEGKASVYQKFEEMLEWADLDVVHICTPHYLHVPMAMEALKRNISVFMEKPPAISKEEFDRLALAVSKTNARIGFCFQNRYNTTTIELDHIVEQKKLGEILGARGFVTWKREADYYSDDWHGSLQKEGGGVLMNQSIHTLDLLLRYLGTPKKVAASMQNHHLQNVIEVEDTLEAWMEFEDGKRACFYATTAYATDAPVILELSFERGRVTVIDNILQICETGVEPRSMVCKVPEEQVGKAYWGKGHLSCIEDFYECMEKGIPFANDLPGVSNTLYTTMEIYDSIRGKNRFYTRREWK